MGYPVSFAIEKELEILKGNLSMSSMMFAITAKSCLTLSCLIQPARFKNCKPVQFIQKKVETE